LKGAGRGIYATIVVKALAGVARPFKPKEQPSAYLAELLFKILEALQARPVIAKFVVLQLSSNPLMDPLLAERLLLALAALDAPMEARPRLFQRRWAASST
jgi:hypothetical protein